MKVSYNWLKQYLDIDKAPAKLGEILTDIGLEVEGIEEVESIPGGLEGIVVGHVIECIKHPNADKLSLTKVNIGELEEKQIVCGAPNIEQGQKVLVAKIGTSLYTKEGEAWKIKKGKIRGELSEGMICAEDELGLGNDHSGIIVLPEDVPVGTLAKDYYNIKSDYVFDIGLTPNRSDATHHLGVARDLAAYLKVKEKWEGSIKEPDASNFEEAEVKSNFQVEVENEEACPRYSGIILKDLKIGPSPDWIQSSLKAIGVRPINNVVDITNYVLHEMGQPLHAFDLDKIEDRKIIVKTLPDQTSFLSLDEKERKLLSTDLMICDGKSTPMCIGGVFGGFHSGVTESTNSIFLEAAHFSPLFIRRSSTHHLLRTDAAKVFEKGSDPNITVEALKRAASLLKEHANAKVDSQIFDIYPNEVEPIEIAVSYRKINAYTGTELNKEEIHDILRAMEMELRPVNEDTFIAKIPTDKADVLREVDVIEEILRIYGFNEVPIPEKLQTSITYQNYPTDRQLINTIADYLAHNGFNEMMGLSLIESEKYYQGREDLVLINNTSNIHLDAMRPDALYSGLRSIVNNINHQQGNLRMFEFGRTYFRTEEIEEVPFLTLFMSGNSNNQNWNLNENKSDFFTIKKWIERILDKLGISGFQINETEDDSFSGGLKYYRGNSTLVNFGVLTKKVLNQLEIDQQVLYAKFDLQNLLKAAKNAKIKTSEISKYPSTERDLSLVIDQHVKFEDILKATYKVDKKIIKNITLFDVYKNEEQLGENKKAYAIKLLLQHSERTLNEKEIEKLMSSLLQSYNTNLGATLRS